MSYFEVIVSNVGRVFEGWRENDARKCFNEYARISKANYGRAGGESVGLYCDGDIVKEYIGELQREEMREEEV